MEQIKEFFKRKLSEYCEIENICSKNVFLDKWNNYSAVDVIKIKDYNYFKVRNILLQNGRILEEIQKDNTYIALIELKVFGKPEALFGTKVVDDRLYFVAFAKEGIINQNISFKAIQQVKKQFSLSSL